MPLTEAAATALSAGIGFLGNLFGSERSGQYNAREAQKNRDFQERMYNQQVQDNINFWKMQQAYNLPSAQLERIREAGLSPLLLYGEGGLSGNLASQAPQAAQAPHGSQASNQFRTPIEMANLALVKAQADALRADAESKRQEVQESKQREANYAQDVLLKRLTKDINVAIRYRDYDFLNSSISQIQNDIYNSKMITTQNVLTLMQGREYQIKNYQLDSYVRGQQLLQGWEDIANGRMNANANLRNSIANLRQVAINEKIAPWQIGVMQANAGLLAEQAKSERSFRSVRFKGYQADNLNKMFDALIKGADLNYKQANTLKLQLETVKSAYGVDSYLGGIIAPFTMGTATSSGVHGDRYKELQNQFNPKK